MLSAEMDSLQGRATLAEDKGVYITSMMSLHMRHCVCRCSG